MTGVKGRVVLVTGASRGIGLVTARLLVAGGAKVMAVARSQADLTAADLPHVVAADLATEQGCQFVVEETRRRLGDIDVLVCNHGIGSAQERPIHEEDVEQWRTSMTINLEGPYHLTRLVFPSMVDNKYGRLVYTSSTAAIEAEPAAVGYNTSKAALLGLMRSAAQDGGIHGITANAVLPGWVKTAMADRSAEIEASQRNVTVDQVWKERAALYPAKRVVTPQEVANVILFLASEESSGVSGESIRVSLACPW